MLLATMLHNHQQYSFTPKAYNPVQLFYKKSQSQDSFVKVILPKPLLSIKLLFDSQFLILQKLICFSYNKCLFCFGEINTIFSPMLMNIY